MICAAALVLAMDASGSIFPSEWRAQVEHTADAIASDEFAEAIRRGGPVAVTAFAFADAPALIVEWRVLETPDDAQAFAARLRAAGRVTSGGTRIGPMLARAHEALNVAPCEPDRRVVDLSTDGEAPEAETAAARDAAQMDGVTINVISVGMGARPDSLRENAATADGFLIHAEDWSHYAALVRRKIILETAAR